MHRLTAITLGVPDVAATAAYYTDFGLTPLPGSGKDTSLFSTVDGGEQLTLRQAPHRRLLDLGIGVDDPDDLDRVAGSLHRLGVEVERSAASVEAYDPGTGVRVHVETAPRIASEPSPSPATPSVHSGTVAQEPSTCPVADSTTQTAVNTAARSIRRSAPARATGEAMAAPSSHWVDAFPTAGGAYRRTPGQAHTPVRASSASAE
ncbi:hypothetical protein ACWEWX_04925 [Streptomyces asiaticus]